MTRKWFIACACFGIFLFAHAAFAQQATSTPSPVEAAGTVDISQNQSAGGDAGSVSNSNQQNRSYESALFLGARSASTGTAQVQNQQQVFDIQMRSGAFKGKTESVSSDVESNPYQIQPRPGDKLVVFVQTADDGTPQFYLQGYDRRTPMAVLIVLFILALILLAGWQGFKVACSIAISIGVIGWVLIPSFLKGANPIPIAALLAVGLTFISSGFSLGWNKKTIATTLGTLGGILFAFVISSFFANWAHLSGLATDDDRLFFAQNALLNPRNLLFAGTIIIAMGVIEDVAVSIASGVDQVAQHSHQHATFKSLFTAGMVIGKDHMSAMANTLIFAYVGASLSTLLLYTQYGQSWQKFLNFESVSIEIVQSLAATIGLVFTVPLTAALSAWLCLRSSERKRKTLVHVQ
ncbi:MAG: YibE/F family protein [Patescibacteria group bacterium]